MRPAEFFDPNAEPSRTPVPVANLAAVRTKWVRLRFTGESSRIRGHLVRTEMVERVLADLWLRRPPEPYDIYEAEAAYFDLGGMAMIGMPFLRVFLPDGAAIELPADQAEEITLAIPHARKRGLRGPAGEEFVKVGSWHWLVCLRDVAEVETAAAAIRAAIPAAHQKCLEFYAARERQGLPGSLGDVHQELAKQKLLAYAPPPAAKA